MVYYYGCDVCVIGVLCAIYRCDRYSNVMMWPYRKGGCTALCGIALLLMFGACIVVSVLV